MGIILDGKKLSKKIKEEIKEEIEQIKKRGFRPPTLAVVLVGNDPASEIYVRNKVKSCEEVGMGSINVRLPENTTQEKLNGVVKELNENDEIDGIIVQLPLPKHLSCRKVIELISPLKDVDGFHPENAGKCLIGLYDQGLMPCTPAGVMKILEEYDIKLEGKEAVMVGHSNIVGKPLANMLINANATVTVCHVYTKDLSLHTKRADILCVATGVPHLIKEEMVKEGAVVIDIGISRVKGKIVGDVDFERVKEKAYAITPVPGGVGPMTIAMLLYNTLKAYKMRKKI